MSSNSEHKPDSGQNSDGLVPSYRWPRRNSKRFAMLIMLIHGFRASHLDVLAGAKTYRGAAVVLALKKAGFPIATELEPHRTSAGAATRIAYYSLPATERANVLADASRKGVRL